MSVRELIRNQKYQIEIPLGYNGDKKFKNFETFYGGKKEAKIKIQIKEVSFMPKNNLNIQDFSEEYLTYQKGLISPKTYKTYDCRIELINKYIGYVKLRNVTAKILDKFYNYLRNEHISNRGTHYIPNIIQIYYVIIK